MADEKQGNPASTLSNLINELERAQALLQSGGSPPLNTIDQLAQKAEEQQKKTTQQQEKIEILEKKLKTGLRELSVTKGLVIFGFFVLLAMVAGMLAPIWMEKRESNIKLIEKINSLQRTQSQLQEWLPRNVSKK